MMTTTIKLGPEMALPWTPLIGRDVARDRDNWCGDEMLANETDAGRATRSLVGRGEGEKDRGSQKSRRSALRQLTTRYFLFASHNIV